MDKKELLNNPLEHFDIKQHDTRKIINAMRKMSFSARDTARAAEIYAEMLRNNDCTIILTIAGSSSAAGCMHIYSDLVKHNMVDAIVATGAAIVDMDFFEAIGFRHYQGSQYADDKKLRSLYIDRIYDTYIDEEELQVCDETIKTIADSLPPGSYSSRRFIKAMGEYLTREGKKQDSLVRLCYEKNVPVFCPAFSDSSAGFGLVMHQEGKESYVALDSVKDFRELTEIKIQSVTSGLLMIGGGVPKNFAQDTVVCAEMLGRKVPMHEYAIQITVADVRDGACSSSTLKEAASWGKVDTVQEQMVFAEATTVLPLIAASAYHTGIWKNREPKELATLFPE